MASAAESVATIEHSHALPVQLTPFVGREREVADLVALATKVRLLTLTGPGGSGKTRLAHEVASRVRADRVGWVDLAPLTDPEQVAEQVALVLHAQARADLSTTDRIIHVLRDGQAVLVLDNCEHVLDAAGALVEELLRKCAGLSIVATSREALGVAGETAWLVPPLADAEAVDLFLDRARAANPGFKPPDESPIATICQRLGGIPLAIELAAARTRVLSTEQIAERLDDAFRLLATGSRTALPRQRTLRGTMDWSHDLLGARERALFRRLAVFAGPFSLDAVEAVCAGEPLATEDILDGIAGLVDKSLVTMAADDDLAAYRILETVRQYAHEKLEAAGEADLVRHAHAAYYVRFAEEAEPFLFGGAADSAWVARVASAAANLRAAALWCERVAERSPVALRINVAINWYWFATGQLGEARQRLTSALRHEVDDDLLRGRALLALAHTAFWQGDHAAVGPSIDACLPLLAGADAITRASAIAMKAASLLLGGDPVGAGPHAEQAVAIARSLPPHVILPFSLYWHGWAAMARGEEAVARASLEEAADVARRIQHRPAMGHPLVLLGRLALSRGDTDEALRHFVEGLDIHLDINDVWGISQGLEGLVHVYLRRGRPRVSARLIGAADALRERISSLLSPLEREARAAIFPQLQRELEGTLESLIAEGRAMSAPEAVRLARDGASQHTGTFAIPSSGSLAEVPLAVTDWLRVDVLGPMQVQVAGRPIAASAWGSARPRELLVLLLMHPDGITKEQVGLLLWPEASTTQLRNNFHVTLHRLRKALGRPEWITLAHERYRIDPAVVAHFDVATFERDATAALALATDGAPEAMAALERAAAQYRGDLLDGEPAGEWHVAHRDRLQHLYIAVLMAKGAAYSAQDRHARAVDAYRRALARDDLREDAVQALMRALDRAGERNEALRVYDRFAQRLRQELRATPAPSTAALHEQLRQGAPLA